MRYHRFRILIATAAVAAAPAVAAAQEPTERPATHTVKKGDTLWDLAREYLGDPFQWPQIYQLNTDIIKDPHWIYPGQVFKLPGATAAAAPSPEGQVVPRPPRTSSGTVFDPRTRASVTRGPRQDVLSAVAHTAVRQGEYMQSPFMWMVGGPAGAGKVEGTAETLGLGISSGIRPIQPLEEVYVTMPQGAAAVAGARLAVFRLGDVVPGQGQVVVPTGIVRLASDAGSNRALAVLIEKYEDVFAGQGVIVLDTLSMPVNVYPSHVEFGLRTNVSWIHSNPQLVMPGNKLILAAGSAQGLVPGDQVTINLPAGGTEGQPAEEAAVAQVTRVTPWGASATILSVRDGAIRPGTRAQVSAKMP